jgi:hypothetical protein
MNKFMTNLKRSIEENPLAAIAVATVAVTAVAKFVDAAGHTRGSNAYAKQVNRSIKNSK